MMKKVVLSFLLLATLAAIKAADNNTKVICYYNSKAFGKEGGWNLYRKISGSSSK